MAPRIFFITGCTSGFGHEYVKVVLQHSDYVVATARDSSRLSFSDANSTNSLFVNLDVTVPSSINAAFDAALQKFGRIDVVVNNAGVGLGGEFESLADEQIRYIMEVNFFGVLNVTRRAMETMRVLKTGGLIQQISSIAGHRGAPTVSMYNASKWAVEGFTEAVSQEVKPEWGIKFTLIEPGGFRTDWAGRSMTFAKQRHPAYDHLDIRTFMQSPDGFQPGDVAKGVQVFYELATMQDPPLRCLVGTDAYRFMGQKLEEYAENRERFKELSNRTDCEGYVVPTNQRYVLNSLKSSAKKEA